MKFTTLAVGTDVQLSYIDSGAPATKPYTTIFAIHGMCFTNEIFQKLSRVALAKGYRFVAVNRRPFPGSTPFSGEEINLITNAVGDSEERNKFIEARGLEIANFIDTFSCKFDLPPISNDSKTGGSVVFGWSLGSTYATAAIAYASSLPDDARARLISQIRSLVVYEPPPLVFGLPTPKNNWTPLIDATIPENLRLSMFGQWVSGYFDNGDYSKRDLDALAYVLPSIDKVPTAFNLPVGQLDNMVCYGLEATLDLSLAFFFSQQLKETYRKVFNSKSAQNVRMFQDLKIIFVTGDRSPAFGLAGLWAVQDDLEEINSETVVDYKIVPGANHFLHWDDPESAFQSFFVDA